MDIVTAAQQKIDDAATAAKVDSGEAVGSSPPPVLPVTPPRMSPLVLTPDGVQEEKPGDEVEAAPTPSDNLVVPPETTASPSLSPPGEIPPPPPPDPPEKQGDTQSSSTIKRGRPPYGSVGKRGIGAGPILAGLLLLLITLPLTVLFVSQQKSVSDVRSRAAGGQCVGSPNNNEACIYVAGTRISACSGRGEVNCKALGACGCSWQSDSAPTSAPTTAPTGGGGGGGGGGTRTTCDNGVAVNSTACNHAGDSVMYKCIAPQYTDSRQWQSIACGSGQTCQGTSCTSGGGGTGGGTGGGGSLNGESCGWCAGQDQCYASTGHAPTKVVNAAVCSTGYCCTGYVPPSGGGEVTPTSSITGTFCAGGCCQADASRGLWVQKCTCSGPLSGGKCRNDCGNAGSYACIPTNFCGSMQLDIMTASGQELAIVGYDYIGGVAVPVNVTQVARNGNGVCSVTSPTGVVTTISETIPTITTTQAPAAGQCLLIKVYKDNAVVQPATLHAGDNVVFAVNGSNASRARIRVNGAAYTESGTKNNSGEYTFPFTLPTGTTNFTVEAEVYTAGQWK